MENIKKCKSCSKLKIISDFDKSKGAKDGYISTCKKCMSDIKKLYRRSKKGVMRIMYIAQVERSKKRNHHTPKYSFKEFSIWVSNQLNFDKLYKDWVESDYNTKLKPSIDRINDYIGYTFDNIRLVTWEENQRHNYEAQLNGENQKQCLTVIQYDLNDEKVSEFFSIGEASRKTKIDTSSIIACCKGRRKTAGKYKWEYKKY